MIKDDKKELRTKMRKALAALSLEAIRAKSGAIIQRLCAMKEYANAETVLAYASFSAEVETNGLLERILKDGKRLALPRLNTADNTLELHRVLELATQLEPNKFGIQEPRSSLPKLEMSEIQLIIVPGLAFDNKGRRLGRGLGCYDKLLTQIKPGSKAVALAFEMQLRNEINFPNESTDMPMHVIVTEDKIIQN